MGKTKMNSRYCGNCGHETHDGPLYKEVTDGDNMPIVIEVCRYCMVVTDSYNYINKVFEVSDQVEMFTIDAENNDTDGYWYDTAYVGDLDQQYSDLVAVTFDDHPDAFKEWNNIDINARWTAGYGGLDYVHAGNKTKAFRKEVETLLTDIKRVSPAGSASFELAKDFMDTHYGEEG